MQKKPKVEVSEVKIVGLKPSSAKPEEVPFERDCTYLQFCEGIKEKFPQFDHKKYLIVFPQLAGVTLSRHNFPEFLENVGKERYSEIHIQRIQNDTYIGEGFVSSEEEEDFVLMAAMVGDDLPTKEEMGFLNKILVGDPTDETVRLAEKDCQLLESMQVLAKAVPGMPTFQQLEEKITTHVVKGLQEC